MVTIGLVLLFSGCGNTTDDTQIQEQKYKTTFVSFSIRVDNNTQDILKSDLIKNLGFENSFNIQYNRLKQRIFYNEL